MSKGKKLLFLLVVLALVIGGYFIVRAFGSNEETHDAQQVIGVRTLDDTLVTSVTVEGEKTFTLEKDEDGLWYAPSSGALTLDQDAIASAIDALCTLNASYALDDADPAEFGLDAPCATLTLTLSDGSSAICRIGMQNPVTQQYYMLADDDETVYLVERQVYGAFDGGIIGFAAVETLPDMSAGLSVTDILIDFREDSDSADRHFVYYPDGTDEVYNYSEFWFYDSPEYGLMSMDTATFNKDCVPLIASISLSKPVAIADEETLLQYGFDDPAASIAYSYESSEQGTQSGSMRILISDAHEDANRRYVMLEGGQYIYDMGQSSVMGACSIAPEEYVTPIALPIDLATIESVDIITGGKTYTVRYDPVPMDGQVVTPKFDYYYQNEMLDEDTAYNWRVFFNNLRAEFADTVSFQLNEFDDSQPLITVIVHRNTETFPTLTLSFYKYDASFYVADMNGMRVQLFDKNFVTDWVESITSVFR